MQLGLSEYLLKPVQKAELESALTKALQRVNEKTKTKTLRSIETLWNTHQPVVQERFWRDLLIPSVPCTPQQLSNLTSHYNVVLPDGIRYCPILIQIRKWSEFYSPADMISIEKKLKKSAQELIAPNDPLSCFIILKEHLLLGLVSLESLKESDETIIQSIGNNCKRYILVNQKDSQCHLFCYIGNPSPVIQLSKTVANLQDILWNNFSFDKFILFQNNYLNIEPTITSESVLESWSSLLKKGYALELQKEIRTYIQDLSDKKKLNRDTLSLFQQDFMQTIYTLLIKKGFLAHQLFNNKNALRLSEMALTSLDDMLEWLDYVITTTCNAINSISRPPNIVEQVQTYIHAHLDDDLSRESIAAFVYLNPDYLDRIFKETTSVTVMKYLLNARIKLAQRLLLNTNLSVSDIATACGYNSLTNFSVAFRKITGESPSDWRKQQKV